jgi:hypothetical protein
MNDDWHEETTDPAYADAHNSYKVEQWNIGDKIGEARLVYASSNLQRAHKAFERHVKQRTVVLPFAKASALCAGGRTPDRDRQQLFNFQWLARPVAPKASSAVPVRSRCQLFINQAFFEQLPAASSFEDLPSIARAVVHSHCSA